MEEELVRVAADEDEDQVTNSTEHVMVKRDDISRNILAFSYSHQIVSNAFFQSTFSLQPT